MLDRARRTSSRLTFGISACGRVFAAERRRQPARPGHSRRHGSRADGARPGQLTLRSGCPAGHSFTVLRRAARTTDDDLRPNSQTFACLRLVAAFRPRHLAFENVPGLVEGRWRSFFEAFSDQLSTPGYTMSRRIVDAAGYGVAQRRRSVPVIGSPPRRRPSPRSRRSRPAAARRFARAPDSRVSRHSPVRVLPERVTPVRDR